MSWAKRLGLYDEDGNSIERGSLPRSCRESLQVCVPPHWTSFTSWKARVTLLLHRSITQKPTQEGGAPLPHLPSSTRHH